MKVSLNWLKELLEAPEGSRALLDDPELVARQLTEVGFEIEGVTRHGGFSGVVAAEVLATKPHPEADKLRIVRVRTRLDDPGEEVVCGAPNVPAPGGRVCWARPGAVLPDGRTLEARAVRGFTSPGMLCSEPELGLGDEGDGILILSSSVPLGADLATHLGLPDHVLEVNVTPNRADALSHIGIARELAAALWEHGVRLRLPEVGTVAPVAVGPTRDVTVAEADACPRYVARFVTDLKVGPSPLLMRVRLQACGIRTISNLVDVTNYVLLETGHPLHAFDLDKLEGGVIVRRARAGETIRTLDGQDRTLEGGDVVICDARGPIALAGVMGGATSEVSETTTRVLLEAATFHPPSIRRTSKRLGLASESSYRFERGVDAESVSYAAARAVDLLAQLGGGQVVSAVVDRYGKKPEVRRVALTLKRLERVAGQSFDVAAASSQLAKVGLNASVARSSEGEYLDTQVPSFRPDIALPEDLVEEILRLSRVYLAPARPERVQTNATPMANPEGGADRARSLLAALGLSEVVTWGFVPRTALASLAAAGEGGSLADGVVVKNPISADYEVMRTSLLPGLAAALARNLARGVEDPALFEVGPVVRKQGPEAQEPTYAAGLLAGNAAGWLRPGEALDFYDVKTVVSELLRAFGVAAATWTGPSRSAPFLHPGVSADVRLGETVVGAVGELHPKVARALGIEARAFYFEVLVDALGARMAEVRSNPPPRFPASTRDVSFWIDAALPAADVQAAFESAAEPLLREVRVLEDFRDPRYAPAGKKGMLWTMVYRSPERTLTDPEVDTAHAKVVAALKDRHAITIR